ncbi:hypothetical protein B0J17DRAFT_724920 [Rhizoctonia solani]|nr:hypothetical protein B0J17DRAFT_724920 [Rhizoctonia solani]
MDSKEDTSSSHKLVPRETHIQWALNDLKAEKFPSPNAAANEYSLNSKTLRECWTRKRQAPTAAHENQMLLTVAQKEALSAWCIHLSLIRQPLTCETIGSYIYKISGTQPSLTYIDKFISGNDHLVMRRPTGIDPKRALAFNQSTVEQHFKLLEFAVTDNNIPPTNEYNMDEKGIQVGGGQKNGQKFICGCKQHASVKLRNSNLELVTVVKCIPAKGEPLPASFILSGEPGNYQSRWFEQEGIGITFAKWVDQ